MERNEKNKAESILMIVINICSVENLRLPIMHLSACFCVRMKSMNVYMNKAALETISYFDTGKRPLEITEPEKFPTGKAIIYTVRQISSAVSIKLNGDNAYGKICYFRYTR